MTTEYLPANAARVQGKIDMLDVSEQAIANVDQALAWVGLKTYTQLCDQLAELAEVAIRDNGRLEQQVVELHRELSECKAACKAGKRATVCPICHRPDSEHSLECPPEFTPRN